MEFAARLFALIWRDLPFMEYAGEFCGLAAVTEVQDAALLHLFRLGACYHRPLDLPDTTGLCWREGVYRCLGSVRARVGTSPSPVALPCPPAVSVASPPAENMASSMIINHHKFSPVPAPRQRPPVPASPGPVPPEPLLVPSSSPEPLLVPSSSPEPLLVPSSSPEPLLVPSSSQERTQESMPPVHSQVSDGAPIDPKEFFFFWGG